MADLSGASEIWGTNANCYAYAMNCCAPKSKSGKSGGTAVPGQQAGKPANASGGTLEAYKQALRQGVVDDGAELASDDVDQLPKPKSGSYLIAGMAKSDGFHFVRRDPSSREWSWLDGNYSPVENQVYHLSEEKKIKVNEEIMIQLLKGSSSNLFWKFKGMEFFGYFWVPNSGLPVAFK